MIYSRAFFDLQATFAETVATLSGRPLARTLLEHTNLYMRFGLGQAARLYERLGFRATADVADCSHVMDLRQDERR